MSLLRPSPSLHHLLADVSGSVSERDQKVTPIQSGTVAPHEIQNEKSWHRLVCYRSACGDTPKEIAQAIGYSVEAVRNVLNQPRSRELIAQIVHTEFEDDVSELLKGGAVEAVMELRRLSQCATMETVKLAACKDILDRTFGKANQAKTEEERRRIKLSPEEEAAEIASELEQLENHAYEQRERT